MLTSSSLNWDVVWLSPEWDVHITPFPTRLNHLKGRGGRNIRARGYRWLQGNIVSWIHQGNCTYELTMIVTSCIKTIQPQVMSLFILVLCVCACYHVYCGVLVKVREKLMRTGSFLPACFCLGLNSGLQAWRRFTQGTTSLV